MDPPAQQSALYRVRVRRAALLIQRGGKLKRCQAPRMSGYEKSRCNVSFYNSLPNHVGRWFRPLIGQVWRASGAPAVRRLRSGHLPGYGAFGAGAFGANEDST